MKRLSIVVCVTLVAACSLSQTASAAAFRRVWERRKAELHGELSAQLSTELTEKAAAAKKDLSETASQQAEAESKKLTAQVDEALTQLRTEARQMVADDTRQLHEQVATEIQRLRADAEAKVAAEVKRLDELFQTQTAKATAEHEKQLLAALSRVDDQVAAGLRRASEELTVAMDGRFSKVTSDLMPEVKAVVKAEVDSLRQAQAATVPTPISSEPPRDELQALPSKAVAPVEEQAAVDGNAAKAGSDGLLP